MSTTCGQHFDGVVDVEDSLVSVHNGGQLEQGLAGGIILGSLSVRLPEFSLHFGISFLEVCEGRITIWNHGSYSLPTVLPITFQYRG